MERNNRIRRAIALGGGGPAVGLGLGALKRLQEADLTFDVWSLSCIGAWLGCIYHAAPKGTGIESAEAFFRAVGRPDEINSNFPIPTPFAPDLIGSYFKAVAYLSNPASYQDLFLPNHLYESMLRLSKMVTDPRRWDPSYFNMAMLNDVLAVHPLSRFLVSLIYRSGVTGLARMYYPNHPNSGMHFDVEWANLFLPDRPVLYFNAYNLTDQRPELFVNRENHHLYKPMTMQSLMSCSALPYILEPIEIDGKIYCEGATVDTVNFRDLIDNHPDLDEIWVVRILARNQIHPPKTLLDAFNNLVMLFASTTSEDSIALFRLYLQERGSRVRIVEVPVYGDILYEWSYSNLEQSIQGGYQEADKVVKAYRPRMGLVSPVTTLVGRVSSWSEHGPDGPSQDVAGLQRRDPDAVIPMVASDLSAFTGQLPKYMVLARQALEGRELSSALRDMHVAHHTSVGLIKDNLEEIDDSAMQASDYEDVHSAANAISLVQDIDRSLQDMVATVIRHSSETRLMQFIEVAIDAVDVLLLTLADAARSQLEADRLLLRKITTDRTEVLRRFRESYFPQGTDVTGREAAGLLSIGDQFEAIVRLAGQYEGLLSSGWSGPRFTGQQAWSSHGDLARA
jgi:predicted acylesterase/phospholipase RssA